MATTKRLRRAGPPRRRWTKVLAVLGIAALVAFIWFREPIVGRAAAGAAYGARIGCSCHFVEGCPLDQCRADFMPGMGLVSLSADEEEKSVSARYLLLARDKARFRPGMGCVFERWDGQGS